MTAAHRARSWHDRMVQAKDARDDAIRAAVEDGMSLRGVAEIVGISYQRVAQIVAETPAKTDKERGE